MSLGWHGVAIRLWRIPGNEECGRDYYDNKQGRRQSVGGGRAAAGMALRGRLYGTGPHTHNPHQSIPSLIGDYSYHIMELPEEILVVAITDNSSPVKDSLAESLQGDLWRQDCHLASVSHRSHQNSQYITTDITDITRGIYEVAYWSQGPVRRTNTIPGRPGPGRFATAHVP
jgi:hypothetical protein